MRFWWFISCLWWCCLRILLEFFGFSDGGNTLVLACINTVYGYPLSLIHLLVVLSLAFCRLRENNLMHLHILFRHEDSNIFHNREKRHRKLIHGDYWRCITFGELVQRYKRHSNSVKSWVSSFPYQNLIFISEHSKLFCNVH